MKFKISSSNHTVQRELNFVGTGNFPSFTHCHRVLFDTGINSRTCLMRNILIICLRCLEHLKQKKAPNANRHVNYYIPVQWSLTICTMNKSELDGIRQSESSQTFNLPEVWPFVNFQLSDFIDMNYLCRFFYLIKKISPSLHHCSPCFKVSRSIVGSPVGISDSMCKLVFN